MCLNAVGSSVSVPGEMGLFRTNICRMAYASSVVIATAAVFAKAMLFLAIFQEAQIVGGLQRLDVYWDRVALVCVVGASLVKISLAMHSRAAKALRVRTAKQVVLRQPIPAVLEPSESLRSQTIGLRCRRSAVLETDDWV